MGQGSCFVFVTIALSLGALTDGLISDQLVKSQSDVAWRTIEASDSFGSDEIPLTQLYNPNHKHDLQEESVVNIFSDDTMPMYEQLADDIVSSCSAFIDSFSEAAANYTECALKYARPIRFCQECVVYYIKARELYDIIMKGNPLNDEGDLCSSVILNSDRVQIIVRTGTFLEKLWNDCDCDQCFQYHRIKNNTISIKLSNDTEEFNKRAHATLECFATHSNVSKDGKKVFNSTVCEDCFDIYHDLNVLYEKMEKKTKRHVCMDIVDMMNSTRSLWSSTYMCNIHPGSLWPVIILSAFFCLMPVFFYGGTRAHGARMQRNLLRQRRLQDVQDGVIGVTSLPRSDIPSTTVQAT